MKKLFSSMTGMILTALGLDRQAVRALETRRDVVPPAPDFQHPQSGSKAYRRRRGGAGGGTQYAVGNSWRHERRETGVSARQQRIKKRDAQGHPYGKIIARKLQGISNRELNVDNRAARRFLATCNGGPGWDRRKAEVTSAQA